MVIVFSQELRDESHLIAVRHFLPGFCCDYDLYDSFDGNDVDVKSERDDYDDDDDDDDDDEDDDDCLDGK